MCWRTRARGWQMILWIGKEKASDVCEVFQQNWRGMKIVYCVLSESKVLKEVKLYSVYSRAKTQFRGQKPGGKILKNEEVFIIGGFCHGKTSCLFTTWSLRYELITESQIKQAVKCVCGAWNVLGRSRIGELTCSLWQIAVGTGQGQLWQYTTKTQDKGVWVHPLHTNFAARKGQIAR